MPDDKPLAPGQIRDTDGTVLEPLADWCAKNGITPNNARGQHRHQLPLRTLLNRHYMPVKFKWTRQRSRRRK